MKNEIEISNSKDSDKLKRMEKMGKIEQILKLKKNIEKEEKGVKGDKGDKGFNCLRDKVNKDPEDSENLLELKHTQSQAEAKEKMADNDYSIKASSQIIENTMDDKMIESINLSNSQLPNINQSEKIKDFYELKNEKDTNLNFNVNQNNNDDEDEDEDGEKEEIKVHIQNDSISKLTASAKESNQAIKDNNNYNMKKLFETQMKTKAESVPTSFQENLKLEISNQGEKLSGNTGNSNKKTLENAEKNVNNESNTKSSPGAKFH